MNEILLQVDSTNISNVSILKDYAEYIVGIPTFIISTLVAYWIYKKQISRKELSYLINDSIKLIDIRSNFKNRFEILFDNQKVNDLSLLIVEFFNSGNQAIKKEDFEGDIRIELKQSINKNIYVLSSDITEREPQNIANSISGNKTDYNISPCLLNPKDKFKVQFLVDFEDVRDISIDVKARIAGIRELKRIEEKEKSSNQLTLEVLNKVIAPFVVALIAMLITGSYLIRDLIELIQSILGK